MRRCNSFLTFVLISEAQPESPPLAKEGQGGFEEVVASFEEICPIQISPAPSLLKRGTQIELPRQKQITEICRYPSNQNGSTLILIATILFIVLLNFFLSRVSPAGIQLERARITNQTLAQAKQALIAYAVSVPLDTARPGDLPCPDNHPLGDSNEGMSDATCDGNAIGRLPWKTLNLPDLRDGAGERLWYAVSIDFKNAPRTGTLNSDAPGTITVRDSSSNVQFNGLTTAGTGAIAVILAPGAPLTRQDGHTQDRSTAGYNQAINYLDIGAGEDNKDFFNNDANGFIQGDISVNGSPVVNDRLIAVSYADLMPLLEMRVANEALKCLKDYAAVAQNQGRYPWPADLTLSASGTYADAHDVLFGRMPDSFSNTLADSSNAMQDGWTSECNLPKGIWFANWRELVFYGLADAYKPVSPLAAPACGLCLGVTTPVLMTNRQIIVVASGKALTGQTRASIADKANINNYLEGDNITSADGSFVKKGAPQPFNDQLVYAP